MKKLVIILFVGLFLFSCEDSNDSNFCDFETVVDAEQYETSPSDELDINSLEIVDNCLKINFSSSGCSGDSWEIKLIDSSQIMESYPPQRNVKLSLKNEELCLAYITKEISFDISNLQTDDDKVVLNFVNSDKSIVYEY